MPYVKLFCRSSEIKFETNLLGRPYSENTILRVLLGYLNQIFLPVSQQGICCHNLQYKDNAAINCKGVSSDRFPKPQWYFVQLYFVLGLCHLKIETCGAALITLSIFALMLIWYIDLHARSLVFLCPHD